MFQIEIPGLPAGNVIGERLTRLQRAWDDDVLHDGKFSVEQDFRDLLYLTDLVICSVIFNEANGHVSLQMTKNSKTSDSSSQ